MENSTTSLASEEMKIVHAIGGRIRLRCSSDRARELLPTIAQDLRERVGIHKVTSNKTTGSLLVEFDPDNFSQGQLIELLQPLGVALPFPTKASTSTGSFSSQSRVYEQLLSLVPPLLGLAVVRGIGVTGWKSFFTYLVATGVIREIWEQLLPLASSQLKSTSTPAVLEPELNAADESKSSNLPDRGDRITPRQAKESFSTDDESPDNTPRHPSKKKPKKTEIASSSLQTAESAEPEGVATSEAEETTEPKTEEAADSLEEMTTENESYWYWSKFKSSMLSMMLQLMGKLPVQTA